MFDISKVANKYRELAKILIGKADDFGKANTDEPLITLPFGEKAFDAEGMVGFAVFLGHAASDDGWEAIDVGTKDEKCWVVILKNKYNV